MKLYQFLVDHAMLLNGISIFFIVAWGAYRYYVNKHLKEEADDRANSGNSGDNSTSGSG